MSLTKLQAIDPTSYDVLSVDVFDTLLLRDSYLQRERFGEVAASLAKTLKVLGYNISAKVLLSLRLRAHQTAYQAISIDRPDGDVTLARICEIQVSLLGLNDSAISHFIAAELDVESRHLFPNWPLIKFMQRTSRDGKRVVAISDMYLSGAQIGMLVARIIGFDPTNRIYSSCDLGATKHHGGLFAKVAAFEHLAISRLLHFGDSQQADVDKAKVAGCNAVLFSRVSTTSIRRAMSVMRLSVIAQGH